MDKLVSTNSFGSKLVSIFNAPFRMVSAFILSLYTLPMALAPTLCLKIKSNINMDTLFGNMAEIIVKLAFYVGAMVAIYGVFSMILAYKDDNADGQTRAIRLIIVGVMLIGFETVLKLAGIVQ